MQFFSSAIDTLQTLVVALGGGVGGGGGVARPGGGRPRYTPSILIYY